MPKLFGVEVDEKLYPGFKGEEDYTIFSKLENKKITFVQIQQYLLEQKKNTGNLLDPEEEDYEKYFKDPLDEFLHKEIELALSKVSKEFEQKKNAANPVDQKIEENLNQKAENEAKKIEEELNKDNEKKPDELQGNENLNEKKEETTEENKTEEKKEESKEEVKTEKKESASNEKTDVKEDPEVSREKLDQETEAFAKNVEKVQKAQKKMAGAAAGNDREMMQQGPEAYLKVLNDLLIEKAQKANRGLLPGDEILQYMQDVQRGKALNAQSNGALEEQMLEKRADTIQNIGEEYQQNKKLTPKLVEQMSAVDAIDNVLVSITRNPKLLFITVLLMGLNPFMALGLAVLSAFGNAVVKDLYQKLPETDRSNLENRPAQEPQPAYNPQFEACQKALAEATQQLKDKEMMLQKYQQRDREIMQRRALMAYLNSLKKVDMERIRAEKEKMQQEAKAEKEVKKPEAEKEVKAEKKQSVKEDVHKKKQSLSRLF